MVAVKQLKKLICEKYGSESGLAKSINWSRQRLNRITNGVKEPDLLEAKVIADALGVSIDELSIFFLCMKSPNGRTSGG